MPSAPRTGLSANPLTRGPQPGQVPVPLGHRHFSSGLPSGLVLREPAEPPTARRPVPASGGQDAPEGREGGGGGPQVKEHTPLN